MDCANRGRLFFLTIPIDIRLMIYVELLAPHSRHHRFVHIPETQSKPHSTTQQCGHKTHENAVETGFIAVVREIPIAILATTCRLLRWEITSLIDREHLTALRKEPLRLVFDASEYTVSPEPQRIPYSARPRARQVFLRAIDRAFLDALCARHLRMKNFPQTAENSDLCSWIAKGQRCRECYWELLTKNSILSGLELENRYCKHGRCVVDPHIEIRSVVRPESGHVDRRGPLNSDSVVLRNAYSALLDYFGKVPNKIWYGARSLRSGYVSRYRHIPNSYPKDLVVMDNDISEDEWLRDWGIAPS